MPLKDFERQILRLLASNRNPDSFVAGATVLLRAADTHRRSEDIDLFHDTEESVAAAVLRDTGTLERNQYRVELGPPQPTFRRAQVSQGDHATKVEWVFDSAFRFFPVQVDPELGYVLNFWDAATNKILALAGRSEVRDYLDVLHLHQKHLSLAALVWAACGKDAGFTPQFLLEEAQRNVRFSRSQLAQLDLAVPVDLVACKRLWLDAFRSAMEFFPRLPAEEIGCLFLDAAGTPVTPDPASPEFPNLRRHYGCVRGAWPVIRG